MFFPRKAAHPIMSLRVKFVYGSKTVFHSDFREGTTVEGMKRNKHIKRIPRWNLRTLLQSGKLENLRMEMARNQRDGQGQEGVGIILDKNMGNGVIGKLAVNTICSSKLLATVKAPARIHG
ncbi:hypothetical protein ILUMI_06592 [Ignelater luminosus]|uniref:Uncharacterized protein n=1 Tax=Ignelater luminosus TaxID=2038154 RepID=A0A8K0D840_IGNLU|nr:hypothetical protein ILUMI_06592 [Ignelater luminosus]